MSKENFRKAIANYFDDNQNIFLYWKGRVALYALLKAMKIKKGDEVIIPGYTCVVVPNAIKYLGAKPIYVDIDKETLNTTLSKIKDAVTEKTKVIISQNTFGLSSEVEEIIAFAKEKNLWTIEDCTHGFGGTYKDKPNGTYCDAAFFSTQWNKPFSTGVGGFSIVNNTALIPELINVNSELIKPSKKEVLLLSGLLFAHKYFINSSTYWGLRKLYRWLSKNNLVVGSSEDKEIISADMPDDYFKDISKTQIRKGLKSLDKLPQVLKKRKENAKIFTDFLKENNKYHVKEFLHKDHSFLKYPIFVKSRTIFEEVAQNEKIQLDNWFCSPIHPVEKNFKLWDIEIDKIPLAYKVSMQVINLDTDSKHPERIIEFLENNLDEII